MTQKIETRIVNAMIGSEIPLPTYATDGSAGMDLRACIAEPLTIQPDETRLIGSGIAISIRDNALMAMLAPRSGLGVKHRLVLANLVGIIDSDYQNEVKVALWNAGAKPYTVHPGERICQMMFVPVVQVELEFVETFEEKTDRGLGGFGHTGRI
jgi:dUTP diphosphatase